MRLYSLDKNRTGGRLAATRNWWGGRGGGPFHLAKVPSDVGCVTAGNLKSRHTERITRRDVEQLEVIATGEKVQDS